MKKLRPIDRIKAAMYDLQEEVTALQAEKAELMATIAERDAEIVRLKDQLKDAITEVEDYRESGLSPSQVAERAAAEREGRLVLLSCKIEDRVYQIIGRWEDNFGCCSCTGVFGGGDCAYWKNEECTNLDKMYGDYKIITIRFRYEHIPQYGKTVFPTREEAEAALAERGKTEHQ